MDKQEQISIGLIIAKVMHLLILVEKFCQVLT